MKIFIDKYSCFFVLFACLVANISIAQNVDVWLTSGNQNLLLEKQNSISMSVGSLQNASINIDETFNGQSIDGLGFMLTQGSAEVISKLSDAQQDLLLNELYNPNTGVSLSMVRISIGASDLSNSVYSYNETDGDTQMDAFSLNGPDKTYLLPILKKIVTINPNIKILATPWTAPTWMKTNNTWIGGELKEQYYDAYANYFVKYLEVMASEGITIWGITPQNEPLNPFNEPSMAMNANQQINFINNHLGPKISNSIYSPKIIAYDHNCDRLDYPIAVLNDSNFVDGAAFHLYDSEANISGMTEVHNATNKNIYFTEQFTSSHGNFDGDFGWHTEHIVIGALRNWSKTVIEWNLANDEEFGPYTNGGCDECLGALTISNNGSIIRNVSYYIISQLSKFIKPNAVRLGTNNDILNVALKNPNGDRVLLVYNISSNSDRLVTVNWNNKSFQYNIPMRSSATFVWSEEEDTTSTPVVLDGTYNITSNLHNEFVSTMLAPNNNAFMLPANGQDTQAWIFKHQQNDIYTIQNKETGLYLGINDNWCGRFGDVQARFNETDTNILFKVVKGIDNNSFLFQLAFDDNCSTNSTNTPIKAIDIQDGNIGGLLKTFDFNTVSSNQQFKLNKIQTLSLEELKFNSGISVSHNKNFVTISVSNFSNLLQQKLLLLDISGKIVKKINFNNYNNKIILDANNYSKGVYFIRVSNKLNAKTFTAKFFMR